jgi:formamidopyrimidine-DNA glycosylase
VPELPEVETIAADLRPLLLGRSIASCELRCPSIVRYPDPSLFPSRLEGQRIEALDRRGKYIMARLDSDSSLVVHLGMTGKLSCVEPSVPEPDHLHVILGLDNRQQVRYRDPRRFGRVLLGQEDELRQAGKLPLLGPEPVDPAFSVRDLHRRLRGRRAPIKALLLDQNLIAGAGNIYADEACFRARIRPDRSAGTLSEKALAKLIAALREVLSEAIANRGSSVIDYRDARGEMGQHQTELLVYGRGGEPCETCGRPLAQIRLAGRSTVFCSRCQR